MKNVTRMLRRHQPIIKNRFQANGKASQGAVEGLDHRATVAAKESNGGHAFTVSKSALFHALGQLLEPRFTDRFCGSDFHLFWLAHMLSKIFEARMRLIPSSACVVEAYGST